MLPRGPGRHALRPNFFWLAKCQFGWVLQEKGTSAALSFSLSKDGEGETFRSQRPTSMSHTP